MGLLGAHGKGLLTGERVKEIASAANLTERAALAASGE